MGSSRAIFFLVSYKLFSAFFRQKTLLRYFSSLSGLGITGIILLMGLGACSIGYSGPVSDHFDGSHFFIKGSDHSFTDMVKWMWEMETVEWPEWVDNPAQPLPVEQIGNGELKVTYVNHATVLIQMDGLNILTDPIWSMRAGPFSWMGVKRIRNPGIKFEDLPKIDLILISHDHFDHLDLPTLTKIFKRDQPKVLAGLGLKSYLENQKILKVTELDWWQDHQLGMNGITVTFVPAIHNSGRGPLLGNKTLWGGFVISSRNGSVYFAGDTGFGDFIEQVARRFDRIRLAVLPIGSYEKRWFMKNQHMNPDDAVRAHLILNSRQSMGIHFATFAEHPEQSIDAHEIDLKKALLHHHVEPSKFWILEFGEGKHVGPF